MCLLTLSFSVSLPHFLPLCPITRAPWALPQPLCYPSSEQLIHSTFSQTESFHCSLDESRQKHCLRKQSCCLLLFVVSSTESLLRCCCLLFTFPCQFATSAFPLLTSAIPTQAVCCVLTWQPGVWTSRGSAGLFSMTPPRTPQPLSTGWVERLAWGAAAMPW